MPANYEFVKINYRPLRRKRFAKKCVETAHVYSNSRFSTKKKNIRVLIILSLRLDASISQKINGSHGTQI
jgi:hypothetical protein